MKAEAEVDGVGGIRAHQGVLGDDGVAIAEGDQGLEECHRGGGESSIGAHQGVLGDNGVAIAEGDQGLEECHRGGG